MKIASKYIYIYIYIYIYTHTYIYTIHKYISFALVYPPAPPNVGLHQHIEGSTSPSSPFGKKNKKGMC